MVVMLLTFVYPTERILLNGMNKRFQLDNIENLKLTLIPF